MVGLFVIIALATWKPMEKHGKTMARRPAATFLIASIWATFEGGHHINPNPLQGDSYDSP